MDGMSAAAVRWIRRALVALLLLSGAAVAAPHVVDELVLEDSGAVLRGAGWLAPPEGSAPLATIELVGAGAVRRVTPEAVRRPDVVIAMDRPELLESGWRFRFPLHGAVAPDTLTLRFLDASGHELAMSPPIPVEREQVVHGAVRHRLFAVGMMGLVLAAALVFWRRSRPSAPQRPASTGTDGRIGVAALSAGLVFAASLVLAAVVPPFQSPDEFDHVERAYALSKGRLLLTTNANHGGISGAWIDDGLLAYMALHEPLPFEPEAKLDAEARVAASALGWRGTESFSGAPGTGYYLPVVYLPQAAALAMGRVSGASIDASYRAARLVSGFVASLLLFAAFLRWRPSMAVMALLLLPMTLFQWSGAGIDALSVGLTVFALALWQEQEARGTPSSVRRVLAVGALLVVVVGCRFHMAPLLLLPLLMASRSSARRLVAGALPLVVIAAWTLWALATTQHPSTAEMSAADKVIAYASTPSRLVEMAWTTLTTPSIMAFYGHSFVGMLGWLDTALPAAAYAAWGLLLGTAVAWTVAVADWRRARWTNAALAVLALGSVVLVPLLLLVMWTPFESPTIDGVQGRYFLLPALALALALPAPRGGEAGRFANGVLVGFAVPVVLYSLVVTLPVLVARYYG